MCKIVAALTVLWLATAGSPQARAQADARPHAAPELRALFHYEPTGVSLLHSYVPRKVPVVFVHGLWSNPCSWRHMIDALEADPLINEHFQFWTFGYSTGDPIPFTAHLFRRDLDELRQKLDPRKTDPAFDRMVLVSHSMGGLVAKMIAVESGDRLWNVISDRPVSEMMGEENDRNLFRSALIFGAQRGITRVVYIATPHRGSRFDRGPIALVGTRLVRMPDPLRAAHDRLVAQNPPNFFREHFRKGLPTSIDELEWGSPILTGLAEVAHSPAQKVHSIIAVRSDSPSDQRTDGLVSYESAHIAGAASEKIVSASHLCQDHADVIAEVRRILAEHAAER
jgi:pimeloyl-ACP methyl ester carboxylesterase